MDIRRNRIISYAISVMMIFTVFFAAFFISAEVGHHCEDEECPICECIELCEQTLHNVFDGLVILSVAAFSASVCMLSVSLWQIHLTESTLVSEKVQLNN